MFKKGRFTGYGKMGDTPVTITYDNGKLTAEPQEALEKVERYLQMLRSGQTRVRFGHWVFEGENTNIPLCIKIVIERVIDIDRWEGDTPNFFFAYGPGYDFDKLSEEEQRIIANTLRF